MAKKKNIEEQIKRSFEQQNAAAPNSLWDNISGKLKDMPAADASIDEKVSEGFKDFSESAPPQAWSNINRQLNIDKVWQGISNELHPQPAYFNKKWIGIAAGILLLLLAGGGYFWLNENKKEASAPLITQQKEERSQTVQQKENSKNKMADIPFPDSDKNKNSTSANKKLPAGAKKSGLEKEKPVQGSGFSENSLFKKQKKYFLASKENKPKSAVLPQEPKAQNHPDDSYGEPKDMLKLPMLPFILKENITPPLLAEKDYPKREQISPELKKWGIGLTYSLTNNWILNNETRQSFDPASLISASPTLESSYGITAAYNLNERSAISGDVFIHSVTKQQYNLFAEGKYYPKGIELNYYKLSLFYKYSLTRNAPYIQSRYIIKIGGFAGVLNKQKIFKDRALTAETPYSNLNYGVKAALGQEKILSRFIIGYGMAGEYDLKNIFKGNIKIPAAFNRSNTAGIGAYLNVKYRF